MKREYLIIALVVLFVWANRDNIPPRFQFWKIYNTTITVQNGSGQDISDVTLVVWSAPHALGDIKKDSVKELKTPRLRDITDVIIRFKFASEPVERYVGTLDANSGYTMNIQVNFAGVVTAQVGTVSSDGGDKSK
ncbi:MAG: hypothetical protein E6K68_01720 [Nitrospirae bacterium]|nr:MAG: hypothetical protein E6K68_01720 [Nitrospirota bacterium]